MWFGQLAAVHNTGHVTYQLAIANKSRLVRDLASYQPEKTRELLYFGPPLEITQNEIAISYCPVGRITTDLN